ncbi:hypothetical protein [Burkholderia cenocepacia]|uniref:hypothetical protein n=1 Tax=Burkholderia cenocepacia TaxID=95486 RepID=UPI0011781793|nr:hypothetical protein [Burkholderia cenocepacia]
MDQQRIEEAVEKAEEAFWFQLASMFPEVKTGDMAPEASFAFSQACKSAVKLWLQSNHPDCQ